MLLHHCHPTQLSIFILHVLQNFNTTTPKSKTFSICFDHVVFVCMVLPRYVCIHILRWCCDDQTCFRTVHKPNMFSFNKIVHCFERRNACSEDAAISQLKPVMKMKRRTNCFKREDAHIGLDKFQHQSLMINLCLKSFTPCSLLPLLLRHVAPERVQVVLMIVLVTSHAETKFAIS